MSIASASAETAVFLMVLPTNLHMEHWVSSDTASIGCEVGRGSRHTFTKVYLGGL